MNVLVVHEVSYRKKVVYEYQEFAERLAARGHRVTVIDYDESGDHRYEERSISRTGAGTVTLRNVPYLDIPLVKYLSGRWNYPALLERAIAEGRVDVVLLYSVFINGTSTLKLCAKAGIPVVYRVLDAYHRVRQNPWTSAILRRGERTIYRNANVLSLTNEKMKEYVTDVAGNGASARARVLRHGVDATFFRPLSRDAELCARHGIDPADRIAMFLGTLYPFAGIDAVIARFGAIRERCPNAKVIVVGDGPLMPELRRIVRERRLEPAVILAGVRPYDEVPRWLSLADVAFNSFAINDVTRDIVPIKMLQYAAAGRAVLSAPIPDVMRLFPERAGGMVYCDIADADRYVAMLGDMLADRTECLALGSAARALVEERYSLDGTIDALEALLRDAALPTGSANVSGKSGSKSSSVQN